LDKLTYTEVYITIEIYTDNEICELTGEIKNLEKKYGELRVEEVEYR
jgi:hypothetical protein